MRLCFVMWTKFLKEIDVKFRQISSKRIIFESLLKLCTVTVNISKFALVVSSICNIRYTPLCTLNYCCCTSLLEQASSYSSCSNYHYLVRRYHPAFLLRHALKNWWRRRNWWRDVSTLIPFPLLPFLHAFFLPLPTPFFPFPSPPRRSRTPLNQLGVWGAL